MKGLRVYLDLDGVGANWTGYVLTKHFPGLTKDELFKRPDIEEKIAEVYEVDKNLFYKLKPLEQFGKLLCFLNSKGIAWNILTAAGTTHPNYEVVVSDKERWLRENFNIESSKVIVTRSSGDKAGYANSDALLIDDYKVNCRQFVANGGHAIRVEGNTYDVDLLIESIEKWLDSKLSNVV